MANMYFSRDTKVYLHARMSSSTAVPDRYYEIPVLDGFSFSQATNATEVTLNEAQNTSGASRRGRKMFNDSLAPAEWSFSTYIQPFIAATGGTVGTGGAAAATTGGVTHVREVSEALWAGLLADTVNGAINTVAAGTASTSLDYVQIQSNSATLGVFDLYFVLGGATDSDRNYTVDTNDSAVMIYKIADCSVNEASIDFDLDGIATVNWSGMGSVISENPSKNFSTSVYEGVGKTNTFIRNRVSDLTIVATTPTSGTFTATMTGGNITISNNLSYLTPETLGIVNHPLGHVTGTRTIGGNFTCYADQQRRALTPQQRTMLSIAARGVFDNLYGRLTDREKTPEQLGIALKAVNSSMEALVQGWESTSTPSPQPTKKGKSGTKQKPPGEQAKEAQSDVQAAITNSMYTDNVKNNYAKNINEAYDTIWSSLSAHNQSMLMRDGGTTVIPYPQNFAPLNRMLAYSVNDIRQLSMPELMGLQNEMRTLGNDVHNAVTRKQRWFKSLGASGPKTKITLVRKAKIFRKQMYKLADFYGGVHKGVTVTPKKNMVDQWRRK